MTTPSNETIVPLIVMRAGQYTRAGETYFTLHGREQVDGCAGQPGEIVTLSVAASCCAQEVADTLSLVREGDSLSLAFSVISGLGEDLRRYNRAVLARFGGPDALLITGGRSLAAPAESSATA